jgi:Site-specific recombinase XerD
LDKTTVTLRIPKYGDAGLRVCEVVSLKITEIDIKYIKDFRGHFNIKTTERYLHVSKRKLVNIVSLFDDLWKKEEF